MSATGDEGRSQDPDERTGSDGVAGEAAAHEGEQEHAGGGAERYGGDPDAGPSVTEEEIERGLERDQAEG